MNFRRLRMGLATIFGVSPRGFFIPYRYASLISPSDRRTYDHITAIFADAAAEFAALLDIVDSYRTDLLAIDVDGEPPAPRWRQDWFPALDAAVLYALVRHNRPSRIVEIGSGHSTRFIARALADEGLDATVTAIDPAPRATITDLPIDVVRVPIQGADTAAFDALSGGDFLVVDSSHILMPGSDVDIVINDILPRLPTGVFVHIRGYDRSLLPSFLIPHPISELPLPEANGPGAGTMSRSLLPHSSPRITPIPLYLPVTSPGKISISASRYR